MKIQLAVILFVGVLLGCAMIGPPITFIRTVDESSVWKSIEIREDIEIDKDFLWRTVVDALSHKFDLEVLTKESGYLRTSWKYVYILPNNQTVSDRYRSRIILKFSGENWSLLQMKSESHWLEPGKGWIIGYDTQLLEDVYGDLQGRLSRVRR